MNYCLEMDKAISRIKKSRAKLVCIQLPDGLKPEADRIQAEIEAKTKAKAIIWAGTCFGACDIPSGLKELNVGAVVQFGHSKQRKTR